MASGIHYIKLVLEIFQILIWEMYSNCVLCVWWLKVAERLYSGQKLSDMYFMYDFVDSNAV
jgi:hypothetical protein